jgi:hypothetical protein
MTMFAAEQNLGASESTCYSRKLASIRGSKPPPHCLHRLPLVRKARRYKWKNRTNRTASGM